MKAMIEKKVKTGRKGRLLCGLEEAVIGNE